MKKELEEFKKRI